jgi:hypothetical protein
MGVSHWTEGKNRLGEDVKVVKIREHRLERELPLVMFTMFTCSPCRSPLSRTFQLSSW